MKRVSFTILHNELRRATWMVLLLMATLFAGAFSYIFYDAHQKQAAHIREDFSELILNQQNLFAQEIYMSRDEALGLRMESLLSTWKNKHPSVQACLRLVFEKALPRTKEVSRCSGDSSIDWSSPHSESIINAGAEPIARLQYGIISTTGFKDIFPPALLGALIFAFLCASLLHQVFMRRIQRRVLRPLFDTLAQNERNAAIAETTQMIAHDVRKPFQRLKTAIQTLQMTDDPDRFRALSSELLPSIEGGMNYVEAMLKDLIETRGGAANKEAVSPSALIERASQETFGTDSGPLITLNYVFGHTRQVIVEKEKIVRVLLNILENAVQALDGKGKIWFETRDWQDRGEDVVLFEIRNDGPVIAKTDLPNVFKAFFTSKRNGHGLGLAIAEKIVSSHHGRIWCESSSEKGTAFLFTLPCCELVDSYFPELPTLSSEYLTHVSGQLRAISHDAVPSGSPNFLPAVTPG